MDEKESFHDVWAAADKPLIDIMKKISNPLSKAPNCKDFSESSDSDSDSSSEGSFSAVPPEFRPNLELKKSPTKDGELKSTPNQCSSASSPSQPPSQIMLKRNFLLNNLAFADTNSILKNETVSQNNLLASETKVLPKEQYSLNKTNVMETDYRPDSNDIHVSGNGSKPLKAYSVARFKNYPCHKMPRHRSLPPKPKRVFHSKCEKKISHCIEFEHTDHSNQNARVKTIELDFADLSIANTKNNIKEVGFQVLQKNSEQKCFTHQRDTKTELYNLRRNQSPFKHRGEIRPHMNKMEVRKHNATPSSKSQFTVLLQKNTCVRWDSTLSLNNSSECSQDFFFKNPETKYQKFNKPPNSNTVEWTFVHEEAHLGNNIDWREPTSSGTRFYKNIPKKQSNKAPNFQQTNININQNTERLPQAWIQKQHRCKPKYTIDKENEQTHCKNIDVKKAVQAKSCTTNTLKLSHEMEEDSQNKCDQYVTLSNENILQKKTDNYDLHVQKESLSQVKLNNLTTVAETHELIEYGKEIADLIIGSYNALSMFISFYNDWRHKRCELIKHFEQLEIFFKDSCKNHNRLKDVLKMANVGTTMAASIPIPHVAIAAKIISLLTSLASVFINSKSTGNVDDEDPEIVRLLVKDIEASSEFYMYRLMCNQQFEETMKLIEKFHASAVIREFFDIHCEDIMIFLRGVLEYNPKHRIFYKKLHKCFQELLQKGSSEFRRRFCEPFLIYSLNVIDVIEYLEFRFVEDFDNTSVKYELEEIHKLIENSNSTSTNDLLKKIRNCLAILRDELNYVEKSVSKVSLFDNSFENQKLDPK